MKLTGSQLQNLQRALISAFPTRTALEQFVQFYLGENINMIAGGDTLSDLVFSLLRWATAMGHMAKLIEQSCTANPNNADLQAFAAQMQAELSMAQSTNPKTRTILFLSADPTDAAHLRIGEELREIQARLQLAKLREHIKLEQRMSVRPADVSQALLDLQPEIVHFSGHGTTSGELCWENQTGEAHPIPPDLVAALFQQFANQIKCVILNACYSEPQANAIAQHIDYVIGMSQAVGDKAAISFSLGFYQALGAGRSIQDAYELGRIQIGLQGIPEHLTPVLIKRAI